MGVEKLDDLVGVKLMPCGCVNSGFLFHRNRLRVLGSRDFVIRT
jgi:hypothetical protein